MGRLPSTGGVQSTLGSRVQGALRCAVRHDRNRKFLSSPFRATLAVAKRPKVPVDSRLRVSIELPIPQLGDEGGGALSG